MIDKADFIAWLRSQPSNDEYEYHRPWRCVVTCYCKDRGFDEISHPELLVRDGDILSSYSNHFGIDINFALLARPKTYGALLDRLIDG